MYVEYCYSFLCGCTVLACALASHVFSNSILETAEDLNRKQTLKCNNPCPFGFKSDVEGELMCECFDPCSYIMCLQGTVCVAEMPKSCQSGACKAETRCENRKEIVQEKIKNEIYQNWEDIAGSLPRDDPFGGDVCSQILPTEAVMCSQQKPRWHFNPMTGKCVRFSGCPTAGNNFARKYYCKQQCRYKHLGIDTVNRFPSQEDEFCSQTLTEEAFTCETKTKRWFYSVRTGRCEKFMGCKTSGNNFSRKISCKAKCLRKRTYTNVYKDFHSTDTVAR
ncbi:BPTI/Kunitz domain-containing protein 4-like [Mya arenaria]|uniref:BPTI/Kunitz domain-containing protein 4-like n=1 Tax=Mya arenaria TaxID=6604 RepID=UPI0022E45D64|nr:BPTI/Kunitz domain-containing protein 4-like [Mya arenaria]